MGKIVKKRDNGVASRIRTAAMAADTLTIGRPVDRRAAANRTAIERVREVVPNLTRLVEVITNDNRHVAVDFGTSLGREIW